MESFVQVEVSDAAPRGSREGDNMAAGKALAARLADVPTDALVRAVQQATDVVAAAFKPREDGPASCTVKFGLKVSGQGDVVIAKFGSELNLEVTVTWTR